MIAEHLLKKVHTVGGCEILHHQTDVWNPSKIMGCLPPINWWFGFRVAIHSMNVQAKQMFGMAVAWPEKICQSFFSYWMNGNISWCNPPKQMQKNPWMSMVSGFNLSLPHSEKPIQWKAKTLFHSLFFSWLKHVQAYFSLANSNEIHFISWGWLLSTRLNHVEIPMFPWWTPMKSLATRSTLPWPCCMPATCKPTRSSSGTTSWPPRRKVWQKGTPTMDHGQCNIAKTHMVKQWDF